MAHLLASPVVRGRLRVRADDFQVDEILGFLPDGEGEHWLIDIRKKDKNTSEVVDYISEISGENPEDIGFCGLKDRHAVTRQWFSVPVGRKGAIFAPDAQPWPDGMELVGFARHGRKLRRGSHRGNRFLLKLRDVEGVDPHWDDRLETLRQGGFPNYFGAQRFGVDGANLELVRRMGAVGTGRRWNRRDRNWGLSTLRALIFNRVLSERLRQGSVARLMVGDVLNLVGSRSWFVSTAEELAELQRRVERRDLAITGPLWGAGQPASAEDAQRMEIQIAQAALDEVGVLGWAQLFGKWRVEHDRRALVVIPERFECTRDIAAREMTLGFSLPRGAYATSLVRELISLDRDA